MRISAMMLVLVTALFFSCRKNNNGVIVGTNKGDFLKLKAGNYWVYERYQVVNDTDKTLEGLDSIYVEKDTTIDGFLYIKLSMSQNGAAPEVFRFLRDSATYTLDHNHNIVFSPTDINNVFDVKYIISGGDSIATITTSMADTGFVSSYSVGIFSTYTFRETYYMHPPYNGLGTLRYKDVRYARNIGMVYQVIDFYATVKLYYYRTLLRYYVS